MHLTCLHYLHWHPGDDGRMFTTQDKCEDGLCVGPGPKQRAAPAIARCTKRSLRGIRESLRGKIAVQGYSSLGGSKLVLRPWRLG